MAKTTKIVYKCEACKGEVTITQGDDSPDRCPYCTCLAIYYDRSYTIGSDDD